MKVCKKCDSRFVESGECPYCQRDALAYKLDELQKFATKPPVVELWDQGEGDWLGIIIPLKSGVVLTNQVGGTACFHPSVEGIYLPLPPTYEQKDDPLYERTFEVYVPEMVQIFLDKQEMNHQFMPLDKVDAKQFSSSGTQLAEAWVPVRIRSFENDKARFASAASSSHEMLRPFEGCTAIIVYGNSD
jgi:hypothetical protein